MNANNRQKFIMDYLEKNYSVKINQLSKDLKVTRETVRKDLYELEEKGLIRKVLGGAVIDNSRLKSDYQNRSLDNYDVKRRIAKAALEYIEPGDTIYLDFGTTTCCLAEELANKGQLTVVTNSIQIVTILMKNPTIEIIVLGGVLRKNEDALFGNFALNNINDIFVNYGFFGCGGIDTNVGITNHNIGEAEISKSMIRNSQTKVILADHTKFGNVALNRIASFQEIDIVITDRDIDKSDREVYKKWDTELVVSPSFE